METSHSGTWAALEDGTRLLVDDEIYRLSVVDCGSLALQTGQLVVCDPFACSVPGEHVVARVRPGEYRVHATIADVSGNELDAEYQLAYLTLQLPIAGPEVTRRVLTVESDGFAVAADDYHGVVVDSGTVCFVDAGAVVRNMSDGEHWGDLFEPGGQERMWAGGSEIGSQGPADVANIALPAGFGENIVVARSGWGDGCVLYGGYDDIGMLAAVSGESIGMFARALAEVRSRPRVAAWWVVGLTVCAVIGYPIAELPGSVVCAVLGVLLVVRRGRGRKPVVERLREELLASSWGQGLLSESRFGGDAFDIQWGTTSCRRWHYRDIARVRVDPQLVSFTHRGTRLSLPRPLVPDFGVDLLRGRPSCHLPPLPPLPALPAPTARFVARADTARRFAHAERRPGVRDTLIALTVFALPYLGLAWLVRGVEALLFAGAIVAVSAATVWYMAHHRPFRVARRQWSRNLPVGESMSIQLGRTGFDIQYTDHRYQLSYTQVDSPRGTCSGARRCGPVVAVTA
ncbi:DUF4241 domain-containing protein [Nocardia sp. NPDC058705]|uniref:DUF4241 domain-containing protein n=1 Tax=Nocardia sp. NPDC058705 TaxID=3346609 RepID=UPI0036A7485C